MANTFSALKRVRQTERRTEYNRMAKSRLRHQIRAMRRAIAGKDPKAAEALLPRVFSHRPLSQERPDQDESRRAV